MSQAAPLTRKTLKKEYQQHLLALGLTRKMLTAEEIFGAATSFFRERHAASGDSVLVQWGVYDWGEGENFEFDLTRQLYLPTKPFPEIWQLSHKLRLPVTADLEALGSFEQWCESPKKLTTFCAGIIKSAGFKTVAKTRGPTKLSLGAV